MPSNTEPTFRIAVIEDQRNFREALDLSLTLAGFEVVSFADAESALSNGWGQNIPDVLLTDLQLPGMSGLELITKSRASAPDMPVILMTGHGDIPTAVEAIQNGAYDFIEKPFTNERLHSILRRAGHQHRLVTENRTLRNKLVASSGMREVLCGDSRVMQDLRSTILRIAPTAVDVLISGQTGTGKELVARLLHDFSGRTGNFVVVNCAGLPESLFESELFGHEAGAFTGAAKKRIGKIEHAKDGTLFLDEINTLPLSMQAKLLRALQEREIQPLGSNKVIKLEFRVVTATNVNLETLVEQNKFRADLFYRLDVVSLLLPSLCERLEDIPVLFQNFLDLAALRFQCPPVELTFEVRELLLTHRWPGNVRELKHAAERMVLGMPLLAGAPNDKTSERPRSLQSAMTSIERMLIEGALRRSRGDLALVCAELDLNLSSLYRKLKTHELDLEEFRTR
jgi:DNA-binding NtrC family response regulator